MAAPPAAGAAAALPIQEGAEIIETAKSVVNGLKNIPHIIDVIPSVAQEGKKVYENIIR